MTRPSLSICVPTHNRASILAETLDHLFALRDPDWEIVISDNASEDETPALLEKTARGNALVRWSRIERGVPAVMNFAKVTRMARGALVYQLADDDRIDEEGFRSAYAQLRANPDIVALYGGYRERSLSGDTLDWENGLNGGSCKRWTLADLPGLMTQAVNAWHPLARREAFLRTYIYNSYTIFSFCHQLMGFLHQGDIFITDDIMYDHVQTKKRMEDYCLDADYMEAFRAHFEMVNGQAFKPAPQAATNVNDTIRACLFNILGRGVRELDRFQDGYDVMAGGVAYGHTRPAELEKYAHTMRWLLPAEHLAALAAQDPRIAAFVLPTGADGDAMALALGRFLDGRAIRRADPETLPTRPPAADEFVLLADDAAVAAREAATGARATRHASLAALRGAYGPLRTG